MPRRTNTSCPARVHASGYILISYNDMAVNDYTIMPFLSASDLVLLAPQNRGPGVSPLLSLPVSSP
jgi:hypothetical protein